MVLKGQKVEVSRKPFPSDTACAFQGQAEPAGRAKRPRSDLPSEVTEKKAKLAGSSFDKVNEIRARLAARFEAGPPSLWEASPPAAPISVVEITTPARFLDLLDSLNAVRTFNRAQADLLAKHGICKFKDLIAKQAVWDTGVNRVVAPKQQPASNKRPRGISSVNVDGLLKTLGLVRPPCYSYPRPLIRSRRPQSQRDISLSEYRQASDSLWRQSELH